MDDKKIVVDIHIIIELNETTKKANNLNKILLTSAIVELLKKVVEFLKVTSL